MRIGLGYDIHKLVEGRKLILAGLEVDHDRGLLGHSDADVVVHALIDAILGAMGMGDIGQHFPDNDMKYKDADSMQLLEKIVYMMECENYQIVNVDINVIAQSPKLSKYRESMRVNLAKYLKVDRGDVNIKFKTKEELDAVGEKLGMEAHAIVLLQKQ